jgi:hypothetical protein
LAVLEHRLAQARQERIRVPSPKLLPQVEAIQGI